MSICLKKEGVKNHSKISWSFRGVKMDKRVKDALEKHRHYTRLKSTFSLGFLVNCIKNMSRNSNRGGIIGNILEKYGQNLSLFISGIHYHELVELEEKRKLGHSDEEMGDIHIHRSCIEKIHVIAKSKELKFYQEIGKEVLKDTLPWLGYIMACGAPMDDYEIPHTPYDMFYEAIQKRKRQIPEYRKHFTRDDVEKAIKLFELGGDKCSGKESALSLANDYLSGRKPAPEESILDFL